MKFESDFVHLLLKDNILEVSYMPGLRITQEIAEKIVSDRLSFAEGKNMATMIMSRGVISMDKAAREYLASVEGTKNLLATAIIVDSAFSSFLGNFFLRVNKTKMPVKIFSNIPRAKKWLQQFIV
jgi:hypothetical protein